MDAEKAMDLKDHTAVDTRFASERIYREGDKNYQINRFAEYPWSSKDRIFAYHMSPFNMSRTTQNFFLKILQMNETERLFCTILRNQSSKLARCF